MARKSKSQAVESKPESAVATAELPTAAEIVQSVADGTHLPTDVSTPHREPGEDQVEERESSGLRTTVTHVLENGDTVSVVDQGNRAPLGVKFDLEEGKPSSFVLEAVKSPLKYKDRENSPMRWNGRDGEWQKPVDPNNPVASRLEIEGRASDAVSRLKQEREQRSGAGRDPF